LYARAVVRALVVSLIALAAGCGANDQPAACALTAPAPTDWRLHTDGTLFRDSIGRVVTLRGVDAGGRSKFAPFAPFDFPDGGYDGALAAYLDRAASWGVNAMRVPFTWAAVEPTEGTDDAQFLARYDALLDGAWARGIRTIVDMHQDVYAENFCGDGFPAWTLPQPAPAPHHDCASWFLNYGNADVRAAFDALWAPGSTVRTKLDAMWDRMVARHKDRPGVLGFEPINEPSSGSADHVVFEATTLTTFFSDETTRLRAAAPGSFVFFEPVNLGSGTTSTTLGLPSGDGLVFAPHYYQATTLAPHGDGNPDDVMAAFQRWQTYATQWNVPLLVGEFGVSHLSDSAAEYMGAHYAAMDALGVSGTEWEYSVAAEAWNEEVFGMVDADGSEFPVVAAIARPFARAVSGAEIAAAYDVAKKRYTLSYRADGGITEVTLPARAFPHGAHITLTGGCVDQTHPNLLLVRGDANALISLAIEPK
jgi:endoglycosylceramidase